MNRNLKMGTGEPDLSLFNIADRERLNTLENLIGKMNKDLKESKKDKGDEGYDIYKESGGILGMKEYFRIKLNYCLNPGDYSKIKFKKVNT